MTGGGQVDPYADLGVSRDASIEAICHASPQVASRHHPNVNRNPGGPERFAAAARAYEILSDPAARTRSPSSTRTSQRF
jgi:curved DNA-binding protein